VPRLTIAGLAGAIHDATTRPSYRERAGELATRIAAKDGSRSVIEALSQLPGAAS
jgi:hypothetical protein